MGKFINLRVDSITITKDLKFSRLAWVQLDKTLFVCTISRYTVHTAIMLGSSLRPSW